jgi:hypothetical protein
MSYFQFAPKNQLIFMKKYYSFMKSNPREKAMSNLQIKGVDDRLYQELKKRAADEMLN